jgi:hypothetical protein
MYIYRLGEADERPRYDSPRFQLRSDLKRHFEQRHAIVAAAGG